ncbi:serine/threonine-protein phosphatase [Streptosporangiaceae bacterium NEAU-GS5]|nr:serine/threonine-protein phosphatase [Streptosporangiaceae bacterium NEAU-GS5]
MLALRYASGSDIGRRRAENQDSVYASGRLLAVADGVGGNGHGDVASATVINTISALDQSGPGPDPLGALAAAVDDASRRLKEMAAADPTLQRMGTTLTALLWDGSRLALAHIGDSRGYMLRDGMLYQITRDHTLVQTMVDDGRMTPEQAATHPRRSLLMRALETTSAAKPDLSVRDVLRGDRYLLCSDGLTAVVSAEEIHDMLSTVPDPETAVRRLIDLANEGGGPDNITCVVADVI